MSLKIYVPDLTSGGSGLAKAATRLACGRYKKT